MSLVENKPRTTRVGGVTGAGFVPGVSGNPGGRPKGLTRRVRDLVGDDGHEIAAFIYDVMTDETARTADRLDAARWLADRAFGKAVQAVDVGVSKDTFKEWITSFSTDDLEAILAIIEKHEPDAAESAQSGEIAFEVGQSRQLPSPSGGKWERPRRN